MVNFSSQFIHFIFLILVTFISNMKAKRVFEVTNIKSCNASTAVTMTKYIKHVYGKDNRTIEMHFNVEKEVKTFFGVTSLIKCDLSGSLNSCEYFVKEFKSGDICLKLNQKGQVWSSLVDAFEPKLECPIKPGKYKTTYQLSEDVFRFLPVPTGVWKSYNTAFDGDELVYCSDYEVKIVQRR